MATSRIMPKISIPAIVQRANDIVYICNDDRKALESAGLEWDKVVKVQEMIQLCAHQAAQYTIEHRDCVTQTKRKKDLIDKCVALRRSVIRQLQLAQILTHDELKLPRFSCDRTEGGLVQDLYTLGVFIRDNHEPLEKVKFNFPLEDQVLRYSQKLSETITSLIIKRSDSIQELRKSRDTQIAELYELIQYICRFGRIVFYKDKVRRIRYCSIR